MNSYSFIQFAGCYKVFMGKVLTERRDKPWISKIALHIAFWATFWIISSLAFPMSQKDNRLDFIDYVESFTRQLFFLVGKIALTYWTLNFLFPRFFRQKKYLLFAVLFILSLIVATLLQRTINLFIYYPYIYRPFFDEGIKLDFTFWAFTLIIQTLLITYPPVIIALCVKAFYEWYQDQRRLKETEKEQLYSELKYLQAQIHPHFFFNTLNNLYGLALAKSDSAPVLILKLSDLMRYMLYETNVSSVPLEKEIHHLQNYIELEKIRYKNNFDIFFKQRGDIHETNIAPLLLLPFVENAFKHGFSESMKDAWISIDMDATEDIFSFNVENSVPVNGENNDVEKGLGLKNVTRRLDLLYPDNYQLTIDKKDHLFSINLSLPKQKNENKVPVGG